jgi:hypothetical protein
MKLSEFILINSSFIFLLLLMASCVNNKNPKRSEEIITCQANAESVLTLAKEDGALKAYKSASQRQIDGCSKDAIWASLNRYGMNYQ